MQGAKKVDMKQQTTIQKGKKRYSLREVAEISGVNEWTIRLWANRLFDILKPRMDKHNNLSFSSEDVEKIKTINNLTKVKGMTMDGIRKHLQATYDQM
jgi:DNA-binding transcriptional MerR regulator